MKEFNLEAALNGKKVVTRSGSKAIVTGVSRDRVVALVHPANRLGDPQQMFFKMDGTKYGPEYPTYWDLMMA